jgi:hypothetical protein
MRAGADMFIVWGKTIKRRKLGFVADFCAVCRDLRTFKVERIGSASHVYYISFGQGELVGHERTCAVCATPVKAVPETYTGMAKGIRPASELISETFPNYYTVYRELLERERKVRDTPSLLTPEERRARMREPFMVIAGLAQQKLSSTRVDWRVALAVFSFVPLFWLLGLVSKWVNGPNNDDPNPTGVFITLALWAGIVFWEIFMSSRRYLLKNAAPQLAASLAPLKPSETELGRIIDELRQHKLKLGKLRPSDLLERIEQLRNAA